MVITVISEAQARVNHQFIFDDELKECSNCKLKQVCVDNLEKGRIYVITKVRPKKHFCKFYGSNMVVVEVEVANVNALISKKFAFEGALITFNPVERDKVPEELMQYWNPPGLKAGDRCKILRIMEELTPKNCSFRVAQLALVKSDSRG